MAAVNQATLFVFLPALVFDVMAAEDFRIIEYHWLALGGLTVVLGSGLIAGPFAWFGRQNWRCFLPTMMFNNCGNLGLPLAALAFGETGLQGMVLLLLVSNLLHFTLGVWMFGGAVSLAGLLMSPVNLATMAGLLVNFLRIDIAPLVLAPISMLGSMVIPIMLFSLGVRMVNINKTHLTDGLLGAFVCPLSGLVPALIAIWLLPLESEQLGLLLLFAGLPPAALNYLLAEQYRQDPDTVASLVLVGNAASVFVIGMLLWFVV